MSDRWTRSLQDLCGDDAVHVVEIPGAAPAAAIPRVDVATEEQLREVVLLASRESRRLLPAGAGEHLRRRDIATADAIVSLRRFAGVLDHQPEDLTLVAQSGVPLHELDTLLAASGQELGVDCDRGEAATLGGAVSGNHPGLHRLGQGSWRDHVLGARVLHADGSITRTGSRVVKSVSGYDLAKLYVGSRGSLVFLLDVNLRVFTAPRMTCTLHARVPAQELTECLRALHADRGLQPAAVLLVAECGTRRDAARVDVVVRLRGRRQVVQAQEQRCRDRLDAQRLSDSEGEALARRLRRQLHAVADMAQLRLVTLPMAVGPLARTWAAERQESSGFVALSGIGTSFLLLGREDARRFESWLRSEPPRPGSFVWEAVPEGWLEAPAVSPMPAAGLQRAVASSFDPSGVLVPTVLGTTPEVDS